MEPDQLRDQRYLVGGALRAVFDPMIRNDRDMFSSADGKKGRLGTLGSVRRGSFSSVISPPNPTRHASIFPHSLRNLDPGPFAGADHACPESTGQAERIRHHSSGESHPPAGYGFRSRQQPTHHDGAALPEQLDAVGCARAQEALTALGVIGHRYVAWGKVCGGAATRLACGGAEWLQSVAPRCGCHGCRPSARGGCPHRS